MSELGEYFGPKDIFPIIRHTNDGENIFWTKIFTQLWYLTSGKFLIFHNGILAQLVANGKGIPLQNQGA